MVVLEITRYRIIAVTVATKSVSLQPVVFLCELRSRETRGSQYEYMC